MYYYNIIPLRFSKINDDGKKKKIIDEENHSNPQNTVKDAYKHTNNFDGSQRSCVRPSKMPNGFQTIISLG